MKAKIQSELRYLLYDNYYVGASAGIMTSYLIVTCCCYALFVPSDQILLAFLSFYLYAELSTIFVLCRLL